MTLGRTSTGAIKIKTDGGLRAVECACCECIGCECIGTEGQYSRAISESNFNSWLKGGQLFVSASISGDCSGNYSETITVPPQTCVVQWSKQGPLCFSEFDPDGQSQGAACNFSVFKNDTGFFLNIAGHITCQYEYRPFEGAAVFACAPKFSSCGYEPDEADSWPIDYANFLGAQIPYQADTENQGSQPASWSFNFTPNP
jgi:hypothetical protein